jgi:hypothetical protein
VICLCIHTGSCQIAVQVPVNAVTGKVDFAELPSVRSGNGLSELRLKKLWQDCGKNPDFAAKTDIIDKSRLSRISNLRVFNALRLHPAYKLIRHNYMKDKYLDFSASEMRENCDSFRTAVISLSY